MRESISFRYSCNLFSRALRFSSDHMLLKAAVSVGQIIPLPLSVFFGTLSLSKRVSRSCATSSHPLHMLSNSKSSSVRAADPPGTRNVRYSLAE